MNTQLQHAPQSQQQSQRHSIEEAMTAEIGVPMAALRAALESLSRDGEADQHQAQVLAAAADEIGRLSHKVRTLMDAALGSDAMATNGRIGDLQESFMRALDPRRAPAITVAIEDSWATVEIDTARFAAALAGLAEALAKRGADVLVRMRYDDGIDVRLIAADSNGQLELDHSALDGLRLSFAENELTMMGVRLHWRSTGAGGAHIVLRQDDNEAFGGAA